jgi:hypothetical protein
VRRRVSVPTAVLLAYVAVMTAYVYAFEHRSDADFAREYGADEWAVLSSVALLHFALGAAVGRWWILLAPVLPVLIAIPAGGYPGGWPEGSVAESILFQELVYGISLVLLGVIARRGIDRLRRANRTKNRSTTPSPEA